MGKCLRFTDSATNLIYRRVGYCQWPKAAKPVVKNQDKKSSNAAMAELRCCAVLSGKILAFCQCEFVGWEQRRCYRYFEKYC